MFFLSHLKLAVEICILLFSNKNNGAIIIEAARHNCKSIFWRYKEAVMNNEIKLTKLANCAGCGAKVGAGVLSQ